MAARFWRQSGRRVVSEFHHRVLAPSQGTRYLSVVRVLKDGSVSVQEGGHPLSPPEPGQVNVKLRVAPCTPADIGRFKSHPSSSDCSHVGGDEGLFEVTETGAGVNTLRPGDLAVPTISKRTPGSGNYEGTWRSTASFPEASLVRVPADEISDLSAAAHVSGTIATAVRLLADFSPNKELGRGDRVVFTGSRSAVAQVLLQLAAQRGIQSVCLVSSEEEAALARKLGASKATELKEFKAMRLNDAYLVVDGEGGVLGFTAARALRFRGFYVTYADASGDGVRHKLVTCRSIAYRALVQRIELSLPVAGQIFSDTRSRGFSLRRWRAGHSEEEARALVAESLTLARGLKLEGTREFPVSKASAAVEAAGIPGGPILFRG